MDDVARVFAGRSNPELAEKIYQNLGQEPGDIQFKNFSDGEIWLKFEKNIRGADVFLIQSTNPPADNILELLLMIDAAKRASARRITAVFPYFGYARQDRKDQPRVPISARLIMNMITSAGASRIVALDLHSTQIQGFVDIPFDHLYAKTIFIDRLRELISHEHFTVVAPDVGGIKTSRSYAKLLGCPLTILDKRRPAPNQAEIMNIIGEGNIRNAIIIDDIIDTGGTIVQAAELLADRGCKTIIIVATHGLFSGDCARQLAEAPISKVIISDSVPLSPAHYFDKLEIISAAPLLAEVIDRIHNEQSISTLFDF
jgi:ribose-phosphate pyrophosphokinase